MPDPNGDLRTGLIINPSSRRAQKHITEIIDIANACPRIEVAITEHPERVSPVLTEFAKTPVDVLAIVGGDGTISKILSHVVPEWPHAQLPLIALLPGGTANMTCGDVGFGGSLTSALKRLCDWLAEGNGRVEIRRRRILNVRAGADAAPALGLFFGAGAIIEGINFTNENIHSRGMKSEFSLGLGLVRSMWGIARRDPRFFRPAEFAIGIDGAAPLPPRDITLLVVSSLERLFLGLHPFWGNETGRHLHTTVVHHPAERFLRSLPALLRGRPNRHLAPEQGYVSYNADSVSLEFDGQFTLDGEIYDASRAAGPLVISSDDELSFLVIH